MDSTPMAQVIVVGAGVGGLTTAAVLAKAGFDVTVLEAHVYPGGCAGTFYYQGYRFDAGATLAGGFYPGGPMDLVGQAAGIEDWELRPSNPAMIVHLPDGLSIPRWTDDRRWQTRREAFGESGLSFFRWQETTADALWELALDGIPWPPQSFSEVLNLLGKGIAWSGRDPCARLRPGMLSDGLRKINHHLRRMDGSLKRFIDGQLLISAQATSETANALYAASALDLPRRGAVQIRGGMGAISNRLMEAVGRYGGQVHLRKRVTSVHAAGSSAYRVMVERGEAYEADQIVFNLTPWNIRSLLDNPLPTALRRLPAYPERGWGAFVIYLGVDGALIPGDFAAHHQLLLEGPLAEGNSIFLSLSPAWDTSRAPQGKRAITISTHTALDQWWPAGPEPPEAYQLKRQRLREKILANVERLIPGILSNSEVILDGTPRTFAYFTGRERGWVGGFPQIDLMQFMGPRLSKKLWMVGDSIFPGQSTAAVALGGIRVAMGIMRHASSRFSKHRDG